MCESYITSLQNIVDRKELLDLFMIRFKRKLLLPNPIDRWLFSPIQKMKKCEKMIIRIMKMMFINCFINMID